MSLPPSGLARTLSQNWLQSAAATEWPQSAGKYQKLHDTTHRGTLGELAEEFQMNIPKGEIVIVIDGKRTNRVLSTANKYKDNES